MKNKNIKIIYWLLAFVLFVIPISIYAQSVPVEFDSVRTEIESEYNAQNQIQTTNSPVVEKELTGPGTSSKEPLVPCGGTNANGTAQPDCTVNHFIGLSQSITNLMFMLAGFVVAIMFMYAGFLLITSVGDVAKIQKAKSIFRRTVIGFVIMFLAYAIVKYIIVNIGLNDSVKSLFINLFK